MTSRSGPSTRHALQTIGALAKARILKRRIPLFVEWNLTFRCNLRCKYCGAFEATREGLSTPEVLEGLDGLWKLGSRWITFGGGEPLLHKDVGEILHHAKRRGFQVYLSTNGALIPGKTEALARVDHVNLSLDGAREVNDEVRGKGAFDTTLAAIAACKDLGLPASLQCVLSSYNLDSVEDVLEIASNDGLPVMFQPATQWLDSSTKPNPIAPPVEAYRRTIEQLIVLKKKGAPIRNSVAGLQHLYKWPDPTPIWCSAGLLTCTVEPDGIMVACHQAQVGQYLEGRFNPGPMKEQFERLPLPSACAQCWCAPVVELALLFSLRPAAFLNALRTFL